MKYIILTIVTASSFNVFADTVCTEDTSDLQTAGVEEINSNVPKHLVGAKITVTLADGKSSTVPAEKFKVVPRFQQFLVTKVVQQTVKSCKTENNLKNRLSVVAGEGPNGHLGREGDSSYTTVEAQRGVVGGAQYQRLVTDRLSIGIQGTDSTSAVKNTSVLGTVGWDF